MLDISGVSSTLELLPKLFEEIIHILLLILPTKNGCLSTQKTYKINMCIWDPDRIGGHHKHWIDSNHQAEYFYS